MHGLPAAKEIVEKTIAELGNRGGKVKTIEIEMGPNSKISPEELELCFKIASEGTQIEGSEIKVTLKPGVVKCRDCDYTEKKTSLGHFPVCPNCLGTNLRIDGDGILMQNITFEGEKI